MTKTGANSGCVIKSLWVTGMWSCGGPLGGSADTLLPVPSSLLHRVRRWGTYTPLPVNQCLLAVPTHRDLSPAPSLPASPQSIPRMPPHDCQTQSGEHLGTAHIRPRISCLTLHAPLRQQPPDPWVASLHSPAEDHLQLQTTGHPVPFQNHPVAEGKLWHCGVQSTPT